MSGISSKDVVGTKVLKVMDELGISENLKSHKREHVYMRHFLSWYLMKRVFGYTFTSVGELLGGKNHTTVISSVKLAEDLIASEDDMFYSLTRDLQKALDAEIPNKNKRYEDMKDEILKRVLEARSIGELYDIKDLIRKEVRL